MSPKPIWRHDARLMLGMIPSYLAAVIATAIGLMGVVGLFELLNFVSNALSWRSDVEIFGLTVAARSPWPWLISTAMAGSGAALCRVAYRRAGQAWRAANAAAAVKPKISPQSHQEHQETRRKAD